MRAKLRVSATMQSARRGQHGGDSAATMILCEQEPFESGVRERDHHHLQASEMWPAIATKERGVGLGNQ